VIFLDWVNLGSPRWSRSLTGLDPVDLIGWMEWILKPWSSWSSNSLTRFGRCNIKVSQSATEDEL